MTPEFIGGLLAFGLVGVTGGSAVAACRALYVARETQRKALAAIALRAVDNCPKCAGAGVTVPPPNEDGSPRPIEHCSLCWETRVALGARYLIEAHATAADLREEGFRKFESRGPRAPNMPPPGTVIAKRGAES